MSHLAFFSSLWRVAHAQYWLGTREKMAAGEDVYEVKCQRKFQLSGNRTLFRIVGETPTVLFAESLSANMTIKFAVFQN